MCSPRSAGSVPRQSSPKLVELIERDGQARIFWEKTPIDLFFSYDPSTTARWKDAGSSTSAETRSTC